MRGFRLSRVLRLRVQLREQAEDALARVRAELAALHARMVALEKTLDATAAAEAAAVRAGCTAAEVGRFHAYARRLGDDRTRLRVEDATLQAVVRERRATLLERRREERQLEKLRTNAALRQHEADERTDMVLLDDLALRQRGEKR